MVWVSLDWPLESYGNLSVVCTHEEWFGSPDLMPDPALNYGLPMVWVWVESVDGKLRSVSGSPAAIPRDAGYNNIGRPGAIDRQYRPG